MRTEVLSIVMPKEEKIGTLAHKAVQEFLFSKGLTWAYDESPVLYDFGRRPICVENYRDRVVMAQGSCSTHTTTAEAILSGEVNIDAWIKHISKKKEEPVLYCVDLTWVRGEAREVISMAIQKKAFEKGYRWGRDIGCKTQCTDKPAIYFMTKDSTILVGKTFECTYCLDILGFEKEISVNDALKGNYLSAKGGK